MKSNLCDFDDAYILVRGDFTIIGYQAKQVAFKNRAPFTTCIRKIDGTKIDNAEDLDLVMPMYFIISFIISLYQYLNRLKYTLINVQY